MELQVDQSNLRPLEDYQEILKDISMLRMDKQVICNSQHLFTNSKSCLTNLIATFGDIISLVDGERTMNVIFLDFSEAFNIVSLPQYPCIPIKETWTRWVDYNTGE